MDRQACDYWNYPNGIQQKAIRITGRHLDTVPEKLMSLAAYFTPDDGRLPYYKVLQLHAKIDGWRERDFWQNGNLAAKAGFLRRRQHILTRDAVELLILAILTESYHGILEEVQPLYRDIYDRKIRELTGEDSANLPLTTWSFYDTIFVTGATLAMLMYVEAAHRTRQFARMYNSHDGDIPQALLQRQLVTARNALLRKSPYRDNWAGILDTIMTSVVGCAMLAAAKVGGYKTFTFHAIMDERVTPVCEALDGKTFPVEEMLLYVNVPPVISEIPHPCRSYITFDTDPRKHMAVASDLEMLFDEPAILGEIPPEKWHDLLKEAGHEVKPLADGAFKGISYENGGGFKVNWNGKGGASIFQYHPAERSHHDGPYFKLSSGTHGKNRYDLSGNPIARK